MLADINWDTDTIAVTLIFGLAKQYRKVRSQRRDFHHKTARTLISGCDVIALEDLNTAGMTKRPEPKPEPIARSFHTKSRRRSRHSD